MRCYLLNTFQIEKLSLQIQKFCPKAVSVAQASDAKILKEKFPQIEFFQGESGLIEIVLGTTTFEEVKRVVEADE